MVEFLVMPMTTEEPVHMESPSYYWESLHPNDIPAKQNYSHRTEVP